MKKLAIDRAFEKQIARLMKTRPIVEVFDITPAAPSKERPVIREVFLEFPRERAELLRAA